MVPQARNGPISKRGGQRQHIHALFGEDLIEMNRGVVKETDRLGHAKSILHARACIFKLLLQ